MKITDIRTIVVGNPWKNWVFVVVETSEGIAPRRLADLKCLTRFVPRLWIP